MQAIIALSNLFKIVDSGGQPLTILDDINLQVTAGDSVAIVGASGSGKSTLLGLMAGLDLPTRGSVVLDGHDLTLADEDTRTAIRGRMVGFVFQNFQLLPMLTALENVMLPLELAGTDATGRARAMLDRVGLSQRLSHYPKHLSGGEQQRVALARAFVMAPRLLLADEPTGNLDGATGGAIADLMFDLNRDQGTTLIVVTHDDSIAGRCARVLPMKAGRLSPGH